MREIKFRGKYFDEWYIGVLVTRKVKDRDGLRNIYILMGLDNENWIPLREEQYDTIGQFTGLHDKNGKEIYEGDIIRSYDSTGGAIIHVISYAEEYAGFIAHFPKGTKYNFGWGHIEQLWINEFCKEVIGNIHDNPELLKGGEV